MYRSGATALTRMMSLPGARPPEHNPGTKRPNIAGRWEPKMLLLLHDQMLPEAGSRWGDRRGSAPRVRCESVPSGSSDETFPGTVPGTGSQCV